MSNAERTQFVQETIGGIKVTYRPDMTTVLPLEGEEVIAVTSRNLTAFAAERDRFAAGAGGRAFYDAFHIAQYATSLGVVDATVKSNSNPGARRLWGIRIEAIPGLLAYYTAMYPESRTPVSDALSSKNRFMEFGRVLLGQPLTQR